MHMTANKRPHIRMNKIRPLGDDVEIKAAMTVCLQQRDHVRYLLTRTRRAPNTLHLINDDDRPIRHRFMPLLRLCQFDMRDE
ncbi:hypothetical protein AA671_02005 [Delftia tsuruhatensis]|nr:hypothetical protein AA671_02005 [Delftia tsuruhatensis]